MVFDATTTSNQWLIIERSLAFICDRSQREKSSGAASTYDTPQPRHSNV